MVEGIPKAPSVPPEVLKAVNEKNLAIFVGAGASKLVGCSGWSELAKSLVDACYDKRCINYRQWEKLLGDKNQKKTITISYQLLKKNGFEEQFFAELERSLAGKDHLLKSCNIYNELNGIPALFITTNFDTHFDELFLKDRIVYRMEDFQPTRIDREKLYHIHGSINDRSSLVFTIPQYIVRYTTPEFTAFLGRIFEENTVLFVGYGMDEFELLEYPITKLGENRQLKHFMLVPYYKGEEDIMEFDTYYFNPMGIKPIGYEKDERGYDQLFEVIRYWKSEIMQTTRFLHEEIKEIDEVVDNYGRGKDK